MMLSQFRMRYPQGCLIGELVTIDRGKYIVRVLVQNEGMMLGSALGTGDTPEEAEDKARERALGVINLDALPIIKIQPQETPLEITSKLDPPFPSDYGKKKDKSVDIPDVTPSSFKVSQPPLKLTVTSQVADLKLSEPPLILKDEVLDQETKKPIPKETRMGLSEDLNLSQPPLGLKDEAINQETKEQISEVLPPPIPSETTSSIMPLVEAVVSNNELSLSFEETFDTVPEIETVIPVTLEPPIASVNVEVVEDTVITSSSTEQLESLDFSEIIASSNVELKRLKWTNEQGREYLLKTYGKRSRQVLDDNELLEFLHYLESLPTPN
ncbi:hypothetical protein [Aphanothece sacrum]|uniref:Uncharacterized protein n=1 Tax=Aphanothece sacrum FPU1 TaxID=1920663 RepID=A0A401IBQ6_APHSA|nr:hypothetical protein [Aphanothece sacrum]GBF78679.1 hypothetical protein AsFPU1_0068 [Aphanothece sacrum FPU1]GBF84968.1 hypothetical protein AsFPU3_2023 [Aphanothece sacrum FPU3]